MCQAVPSYQCVAIWMDTHVHTHKINTSTETRNLGCKGICLCVVPGSAGHCFCWSNTKRPPTTVLEVCCIYSSSLDDSSPLAFLILLFSSISVIVTFLITHALIYCRDDVQVFSGKMQQGSMSLHAKSLVSSQCSVCLCLCVRSLNHANVNEPLNCMWDLLSV